MPSRLASLLVQDGLVSAQKMAEAFQRQVLRGGSLDTALLELGLIDEEVLVEYLGQASELPPPDPPRAEPGDTPPSQWLDAALAQRYHVAPLALDGEALQVVVVDPPDRAELAELSRTIGRAIDARIVPEVRLYVALERAYFMPPPSRYAQLAAKLQRLAEERARDPLARRAVRRPRATEAAPPSEPGAADAPAVGAASLVMSSMDGVPHALPRVESRAVAITPLVPPKALPLRLGMETLARAVDRDTVLVTLCRMARAQFSFAAIYTVHADEAVARVALGDQWLDGQQLACATIALDQPSPFRAAVLGRAPYLGRIDEDAPTVRALGVLGRPSRLWAALLPVRIRDRTVAVLHADDQGRRLDASEVADLVLACTEASLALQRIIVQGKAGSLGKAHTGGALPAGGTAIPTPMPPLDPGRAASSSYRKQPRRRATTPGGADSPPPRVRRTTLIDVEPSRAMAQSVRQRVEAALEAAEAGGEGAEAAAAELLSLGDDAAWAVARRLPGFRLDAVEAPSATSGPLFALVTRFGARIVPYLVPRLESSSPEVREAVAHALGELRPLEAIGPLGACLFDDEPTVRRTALASLARFSPGAELETLLETLRAALAAPEPDRQRLAAEALGELRDPKAVPPLVELVKHPKVDVVDAAHTALVAITKQDFGASRWRWRAWWEKEKERSRIDWLLAGLEARGPGVRRSASEELQQITSDQFGYHAAMPREAREAARQRWLAWYRQHPAAATDEGEEPSA